MSEFPNQSMKNNNDGTKEKGQKPNEESSLPTKSCVSTRETIQHIFS